MTRILLQGIDDRGKAGVFLDRDTEFRVSVTDQRGTVAPLLAEMESGGPAVPWSTKGEKAHAQAALPHLGIDADTQRRLNVWIEAAPYGKDPAEGGLIFMAYAHPTAFVNARTVWTEKPPNPIYQVKHLRVMRQHLEDGLHALPFQSKADRQAWLDALASWHRSEFEDLPHDADFPYLPVADFVAHSLFLRPKKD